MRAYRFLVVCLLGSVLVNVGHSSRARGERDVVCGVNTLGGGFNSDGALVT